VFQVVPKHLCLDHQAVLAAGFPVLPSVIGCGTSFFSSVHVLIFYFVHDYLIDQR
jgi:hypothetical protein